MTPFMPSLNGKQLPNQKEFECDSVFRSVEQHIINNFLEEGDQEESEEHQPEPKLAVPATAKTYQSPYYYANQILIQLAAVGSVRHERPPNAQNVVQSCDGAPLDSSVSAAFSVTSRSDASLSEEESKFP